MKMKESRPKRARQKLPKKFPPSTTPKVECVGTYIPTGLLSLQAAQVRLETCNGTGH